MYKRQEVDQGEALDLCALDPPASVFVAARIVEGTAMRYPGALLGYRPNGRLEALCWAAANIVPVAVGAEAAEAFVPRLRRLRRQTASVFGPSDQVELLWSGLMTGWSQPGPSAPGSRSWRRPPGPRRWGCLLYTSRCV